MEENEAARSMFLVEEERQCKKRKVKYTRSEFLELAATRLSFPGGKIQGNFLVPDDGYVLEPSPKDDKTVFLKRQNDGGEACGVVCVCALEGGGCHHQIYTGPDGSQELSCIGDEGCGRWCFMELAFAGGVKINVMM
ncbi:hypothetical protein ACFIOY_36525 [Bradyrhizobium sp. TZ2]